MGEGRRRSLESKVKGAVTNKGSDPLKEVGAYTLVVKLREEGR